MGREGLLKRAWALPPVLFERTTIILSVCISFSPTFSLSLKGWLFIAVRISWFLFFQFSSFLKHCGFWRKTPMSKSTFLEFSAWEKWVEAFSTHWFKNQNKKIEWTASIQQACHHVLGTFQVLVIRRHWNERPLTEWNSQCDLTPTCFLMII